MKERGNVLIVEDDLACRRVLQRLVQGMRLEPLLAENIAQARRFLARSRVQLILLDRLLGKDRDSLAFCLKLKKNIQTRPIPIIVLTGMAGDNEELEGYRYGADLYLPKPFSTEKLERYIRTFLKRLPYREELRDRIAYGNVLLDATERTLTIGGRTFRDLPARQFNLLALLASRKGRAVSRADLIKKLWDEPVRDREVDVLICRLKRRLGPAASCIVPVRSYGYRLGLLSG